MFVPLLACVSVYQCVVCVCYLCVQDAQPVQEAGTEAQPPPNTSSSAEAAAADVAGPAHQEAPVQSAEGAQPPVHNTEGAQQAAPSSASVPPPEHLHGDVLEHLNNNNLQPPHAAADPPAPLNTATDPDPAAASPSPAQPSPLSSFPPMHAAPSTQPGEAPVLPPFSSNAQAAAASLPWGLHLPLGGAGMLSPGVAQLALLQHQLPHLTLQDLLAASALQQQQQLQQLLAQEGEALLSPQHLQLHLQPQQQQRFGRTPSRSPSAARGSSKQPTASPAPPEHQAGRAKRRRGDPAPLPNEFQQQHFYNEQDPAQQQQQHQQDPGLPFSPAQGWTNHRARSHLPQQPRREMPLLCSPWDGAPAANGRGQHQGAVNGADPMSTGHINHQEQGSIKGEGGQRSSARAQKRKHASGYDGVEGGEGVARGAHGSLSIDVGSPAGEQNGHRGMGSGMGVGQQQGVSPVFVMHGNGGLHAGEKSGGGNIRGRGSGQALLERLQRSCRGEEVTEETEDDLSEQLPSARVPSGSGFWMPPAEPAPPRR